MTFGSKVLARTKKYDGRTDGQTDGHPKPIGPQPFGLGPNQIHEPYMTQPYALGSYIVIPK